MTERGYDVIAEDGRVPIKAWTRGVPVEESALRQLRNVAAMPFIHQWVAVMPDVHWGIGATVGSVIPTVGAVIPAAVGVDIGCGMMAVQTTLTANDLPESLREVRAAIEQAVPHGISFKGRDKGSWREAPAPA